MAAFFAGVPPFFFLLSVWLQAGLGYSAPASGATQLPFAVATALGSLAATSLTRRLGPRTLTAATGIITASMLNLSLIVRSSTGDQARPWDLTPSMAVGGLAFGVFTASVLPMLLADVPAAAAGFASGLLTTVQQAAGSVGLTAGSMVFYASRLSDPAGPGRSPLRQMYTTGFCHALLYETVMFGLACAGTVVLGRHRPGLRDSRREATGIVRTGIYRAGFKDADPPPVGRVRPVAFPVLPPEPLERCAVG